MYAHEIFSTFKEQIDVHFGSIKSHNVYLKSEFQSDTAKIWSDINMYEDQFMMKVAQKWTVLMVVSASQMIVILGLLTTFWGLVLGEHFREMLKKQSPWMIGLITVAALIIAIERYLRKEKNNRFANVRDLITGCIETDLTDI